MAADTVDDEKKAEAARKPEGRDSLPSRRPTDEPGPDERGPAYSVAVDEGPTLYRQPYLGKIKAWVRTVWDIKKSIRGKKQTDLAKWLGITDSAVSKLLLNDNGHPWTPVYLRKAAAYMQVEPRALLPTDLVESLGVLVDDQKVYETFTTEFVKDCEGLVRQYFFDKGIEPTKEGVSHWADALVQILDGTHPTLAEMKMTLERIIHERAMKNAAA